MYVIQFQIHTSMKKCFGAKSKIDRIDDCTCTKHKVEEPLHVHLHVKLPMQGPITHLPTPTSLRAIFE